MIYYGFPGWAAIHNEKILFTAEHHEGDWDKDGPAVDVCKQKCYEHYRDVVISALEQEESYEG